MRPAETLQRTVLVIEDDPWTRTVTTALLAGEGYAVIEAKNGEEGLARAAEHRPDVVLLDLALPTMSGLDVLRALKRTPATSATPVLIVSAYASLMSEEDAQQAEAIIQKPFDCDDLVGQVDRAAQNLVPLGAL
jgi:two-component system cell cycle response regulator DivK